MTSIASDKEGSRKSDAEIENATENLSVDTTASIIGIWRLPFLVLPARKSLMKLDDRRVVLPECPPDPKSDREVLASALKKVEEARRSASVQKTNPQVWQKFAEVAFENQDYLSTLSALQALQKLQPQLTSRQKRLLGYSLKECGLAQPALPILREVPRRATERNRVCGTEPVLEPPR